MLTETSLCMGCMCDKTYEGPCKLCGYSEDAPCIPCYLRPRTLLNERYIIGKVLSYNGEGAVYVGYDTATGVKVNIKEFMPDTLCTRKRGEDDITVNADMNALYKTYMSEFQDLHRTLMKSRGIAHLQMVLDVFCENNTAYAVLEHISGIPLSTYLSNASGELTWEQIKELFPPMFTTLSLLHAAGVIHRGISPSTVYVTDKLELKLSGFSISAARTTNTEIACEIFAGYAAPEQYTADALNGTWTDVYGIAAVLYRCLTGCTPTEAIARTGGSMLEPMMINRNVPSGVSKAVMKGMILSTENRVRTITEFVDKLFEQPKYIGIAKDQDVPMTKQQAKKLKKQKKERAKTIAVLVIAGLVLIAFIAALVWANDWGKNNNSSESTSPAVTTPATTSAATQSTTSAPAVTESQPTESSEPAVEANIMLPNFTNRRYENTVKQYEGTFTFVVSEWVYNDDYKDGTIFEQDIAPDTLVAAGQVITVKVSKGPGIVELPDYKDLTVDKYVQELNKLNIKYKIQTEETNEVEAGQIIRCNKSVGDPVSVETSEEITVFVAMKMTETPDETSETSSENNESSTESSSDSGDSSEGSTESSPAGPETDTNAGGVPVN